MRCASSTIPDAGSWSGVSPIMSVAWTSFATRLRSVALNWWRSSVRTGCWSSACWRPAWWCWLIHPNQAKAGEAAFQGRWRQVRRLRCFRTGGAFPYRPSPFPRSRPGLRREQGAQKVLTRAREDLVETRVTLANRLRSELEAFWPGAAVIFSEVGSPIALAFLERYPSAGDARRPGEKRLSGFLCRHGYCGRKGAGELLGRLSSVPKGRAGEVQTEARRTVVLSLVAILRPLVEHT